MHSRGFGPDRYIAAQGKTNAHSRYYKLCLVGNRPELMPLDSNLNADHERGMIWHVALTSNLPNDDPKKFKMGQPSEVSDAMDRTWQVFPTPERVVQDILRFPAACRKIIEAEGAVVHSLNNRKGRRATIALPYHDDCADAVRLRNEAWDAIEAGASGDEIEVAAGLSRGPEPEYSEVDGWSDLLAGSGFLEESEDEGDGDSDGEGE